MKTSNNQILIETSKKISRIVSALDSKCYIVGGMVRNALLNIEKGDIDLTCKLSPEDMLERLSDFRVIPTGLQHQTITVVNNIEESDDKENIEITSFRTLGMSPEGGLKLGESIEEDLSCRDFNINAIAYDIKNNRIIDPYNGLKDLENKVIQAVQDPKTRFSEDPLRIMRMLRFSSELDFEIESSTLGAAKDLYLELKKCSIERIREEFSKLLIGKNPSRAIALMQEIGIMDLFIPEFSTCYSFEQNKYHHKDVFFHTLDVIENIEPKLLLRLSAFFHDIGKPPSLSVDEQGERHFYKHEHIGADMTKEIMKRLKYPNKLTKEVAILVHTHMRPTQAGKPGLRRILRDTEPVFSEWRKLKEADSLAVRDDVEELNKELQEFDIAIEEVKNESFESPFANLAINGDDLIELGLEPSIQFKEILSELQEDVLDNPELNNKAELIKRAKLIAKIN